MKKILIACDKFKGSMNALQACNAIAQGLNKNYISDICPISDGGEGFTQMMVAAGKGNIFTLETVDALGRNCFAEYGLLDDGKIAVMEMAAASGIWRIPPQERDVMNASTYGTGLMMRKIIEKHAPEKILIGIGGSATNDAGCGFAAALGVKFHGVKNITPLELVACTQIDESQKISLPEMIAACDVENPLFGKNGASRIYGPQKGASPEQVELLDTLLEKISQLTDARELANVAGAGAAGGLGFGLLRFANAKLQSGFSLVAEALLLEKRIMECDIVITGEGSLDAQSLSGKGPVGIAKLAKKHHKPCIALAGMISEEVRDSTFFTDCISLKESGHTLNDCMQQAESITEKMVKDFFSF